MMVQGGRRQELVDATFQCIAKRGMEGLRLRSVAEAVGIDHSTLHHHFATKQALVSAVVEHVTRQFWTTLPAEGAPAERLHHHLVALGRLIRQSPELFIVLGELDLRGRRDPAVGRVLDQVEAGWRDGLTEVWRQGAWAAGLAPEMAVELIIAVVKGVRLLPDRAEAVLDGLERMLLGENPETEK